MKDDKNPRIAINHPSGSRIEINEMNEGEDTGVGGDIWITTVSLLNMLSRKVMRIVSQKSLFIACKDTLLQNGDIIANQAKAEFNVECGNKKEEVNQLTMKGQFITLTNGGGDNVLEISNTQDNNPAHPADAGITIKRKKLAIKITDDEIIMYSGEDADASLTFIKLSGGMMPRIDINCPGCVYINDILQSDD